jgi:hypothetical protein
MSRSLTRCAFRSTTCRNWHDENGVPVCQVGEGADELFWGYPMWKLKLKLQQANDMPGSSVLTGVAMVGLRMAGQDQGPPYEALRRVSLGQPVFWGGADTMDARVVGRDDRPCQPRSELVVDRRMRLGRLSSRG